MLSRRYRGTIVAILDILRLGHPSLREPARPLDAGELAAPEVQALIDDMIETMRAASGVGLAAPQVGRDLQLFVWEAEAPDGEAPPSARAIANPMIEPESGELIYEWEGCLSIPELRGLVPRHPAIRLHGIDRDGSQVDEIVEGFEARIVQHENDHLNGVVFLDRMRDLRSLAFREEWERYLARAEEPARKDVVG